MKANEVSMTSSKKNAKGRKSKSSIRISDSHPLDEASADNKSNLEIHKQTSQARAMAEIDQELAKVSLSARVDVPEDSLNMATLQPDKAKDNMNATGNNFTTKKSKEAFEEA